MDGNWLIYGTTPRLSLAEASLLRKQCGEELVQGSKTLAFPRVSMESLFRAI